MTPIGDSHPPLAFSRRRPLRVLSVDGGGVRGIIATRFLGALEAQSDRPIAGLFDLMVGTSVGGLAILALATPDSDGRPAHSADSATAFFENHKHVVFPNPNQATGSAVQRAGRRMTHARRNIAAAFGHNSRLGNARYPPYGYEQALKEHFGDRLLSEAITPVVVTSYDARAQEPIHFRSTDAVRDHQFEISMAAAARATTATPTFFPPTPLKWAGSHRILLDGGTFANSVSLTAYTEARTHAKARGHDPGNIILVSLGSGRQTDPRTETYDHLTHKNWYKLSATLLKGLQIGQEESHDHILNELLGASYCRFQPSLPDGPVFATDNVSEENLDLLGAIADEFVTALRPELDQLVRILARN